MDDQILTIAPQADVQPREKVVVHAAYPLWRKHLLMAVARARELQDAGSVGHESNGLQNTLA